MNANKDDNFVYCTPYLDEITRIRKGTNYRFDEPEYFIVDKSTGDYINTTKIDCFEDMLANSKDIAVSHTTFLNATDKTIQLIEDGEYTLILDEALEAVQEFNDIQTVDDRQAMNADDIKTLIEGNFIYIDNNGKVSWTGNKREQESKFREVQRMADLGRLYIARNKLLVTVFPPEMFSAFKKVYILSYMINAEIIIPYFKLFGIEYQKSSITKDENTGLYKLIPYSIDQDIEYRKRLKNLVNLCEKEKINNTTRTLSKRWFETNKNSKQNGIEKLKKDIKHFWRCCVPNARATNGDIMWTTYKDFRKSISIPRYNIIRQITKKEMNDLSPNELKELEKKLNCFVPCNTKATNLYSDRWALVYACRLSRNPYIDSLFEDFGINPNSDLYGLSSLIQWINRSRLRNGEPIELYIPSSKLKKQFSDWLNCK